MEMCSGGELLENLLRKGPCSEAEASDLIYKLLHAINHLHSMNISHRDLKPENLMFSHEGPGGEIKIIDFGLAAKFGQGDMLHSIVGTPYYVAPEVLNKNYDQECDIWSLGAVMYLILVGKPPFSGSTTKDLFVNILEGNYSLEGKKWESISDTAKDLLRKMLCVDPRKRIMASEAIEHSWFSLRHSPSNLNTKPILKRLKRFNKNSKLRKDIMNVLVRYLNTEELTQLNSVFRVLDTDHTGYITTSELKEALTRLGLEATQESINELVAGIDIEGIGKIKYSEFLSATIDRKFLIDKEFRWMTFKFFDEDDNGFITKDNIKHALEIMGLQVSEEEVKSMIREEGFKYENYITFEEFSRILDPRPEDYSRPSSASMKKV